jgi:hypothetical protein
MPKKRSSRKSSQRKVNPLNNKLILNAFFNRLFGGNDFKDIQQLLKDVKEGFDEEGHSYVFYSLKAQKGLALSIDKLEQYDSNIRGYVNNINQAREHPVVLKYFQYLAVLYSEIFLERYFENSIGLLNELNDHAVSLDNNDIFFAKDDLTKLAFWMATGSGKTLLLHINYLQFMRYNQGPNQVKLDNILLITPNEGLSNQHVNEMRQSGIPCALFDNSRRGYFSSMVEPNQVQVIDIHKFTEEKKGHGVTVDVEYFGKKNLLFVDEGHKGSGGEKWRDFRKLLADEGFAFEYSATFGQAVAATTKDSSTLVEEYGKAILFDYSYKYFYKDGYGKDYRILNLKEHVTDTSQNILMLANLVSFFEQILVFEENHELIKEYNIEKPLWIFVGSKVKGQKEQSDILTIVRFLSLALKNEGNWTVDSIKRILDGKSGLIDEKDRDIYSPTYPDTKLKYIREKGLTPEEIYKGLLIKVFNVPSSASLHLVNIKKADGEIALRAGASESFGVINIGDDAEFLKLVKDKEPGIPAEPDELSSSLFASINAPKSKTNILIGAKKFIEGWNSWRVSNMGLLNIGKKEGSQIIQLFGRGVRLRGKDFSLKRSSALEISPPKYLRILETLSIFGIKANYMDQFREYLEEEVGPIDTFIEIPIPIKVNQDYLKEGLLVTYIDKDRFKKEQFFHLVVEDRIKAKVDLTPKVEIIASSNEALEADISDNPQRVIADNYLQILDWQKIYFTLLDYRRLKGWSNLIFDKETLKKIVEKRLYELYCPETYIMPQKFEDLGRLAEIVEMILKRYVQTYFDHNKNNWIQDNLNVRPLDSDHGNLNFGGYLVNVKETDSFAISEVQALAKSGSKVVIRKGAPGYITNVSFDRHLYQPLLAKENINSSQLSIQPQGLNVGEKQFVCDLKRYLKLHANIFSDKDVFLLRNLPRRGIGFFETSYFYPDFIIWVKTEERQNIIFVDPKGIGLNTMGLYDEKIMLHERIKDFEKKILAKNKDVSVILDSFIVSVTRYEDVRASFGRRQRSEIEENQGILFQEDRNYIEKIMKCIDTSNIDK